MNPRKIAHIGLLCMAAAFAHGARGAGLLIPTDDSAAPMVIKNQRVRVEIRDTVATTEINQVFSSRSDRPLEAVYLFPLPKGASVSDFSMWVKGKEVKGELLDKRTARSHYNQITRRRRDPALLEQLSDKLFRISVSPVPPRGEQRIRLVYTQVIPYRSGVLRYTYPLATGKSAPTELEQELSLTVRIRTKTPVLHVYSPTHPVDVTRPNGGGVLVGLEEPKSALDRDFKLLVSLKEKRNGVTLVTYRASKDEDGYFLALVSVPATPQSKRLAKDVIFVVDTSGSMRDDNKIDQARRALAYCIGHLGPRDRFNVLRFATGVEALAENLVVASPRGKKRGLDFIQGLRAAGGTNIGLAIERALQQATDPKRPVQILFITDGRPSVGQTDRSRLLEIIRRHAPKGRDLPKIYAFGVGSDVNTKLLDGMAELTGASRAYVEPGESIDEEVAELFDRVRKPVLTKLRLRASGVNAYDVFPSPLPPLYDGRQLVVTGRFKQGADTAVRVTGDGQDGPVTLSEDAHFPQGASVESTYIPRLWAMRKIGALLDAIRLNGERGELVSEVVSLSKKHGVVTPYTSYLVLENERMYRNRGIARARRRADGTTVSANRSTASGKSPVFTHESMKITDHFETENEMDLRSARGHEDAIGNIPMGGVGVVGNIGVGGGASGAFGFRNGGGRKKAVGRFGGSAKSESAVDAALAWLARHQEADGSWAVRKNGGTAAEEYSVANTGLALLAYLGAGHTERTGKHKDNVKKAVRYLIGRQDNDGQIGTNRNSSTGGGHNHFIAGLALAEAYGMAKVPATGKAAQKAVSYSVGHYQVEYSGAGYRPKGPPDTRVTVWMVMQFKSAKVARLQVSGEGFQGTINWLDQVMGKDGAFARQPRGTTDIVSTAGGTLSRMFLGWPPNQLHTSAEHLSRRLPQWGSEDRDVDFTYWYFGTLAMFQMGGDHWKAWNGRLRDLLVRKQQKGGDGDGSWKPVDGEARARGRVYSTALGALCLEVYYRYLPIYRASSGHRSGRGSRRTPRRVDMPETGEKAVQQSETIRKLREADHIGGN